ncbi:MAG: indolepyruvate oxidoreductase [marine bacterium B5-7]|nr:MAG: indolepyruvate oxidoreductase [marine bacterium B5-7]
MNTAAENNPARIIKLAIMAVGGQGGGVLTNWITDLAQRSGYMSQATSVAGVAQRTGATIYYIEMTPQSVRQPVFSLMPAAGDVDILIAAEMMEAGRGILRGFVTPHRTTLIASSHRMLAVSEKTHPGDGIAYNDKVIEAAAKAAQRVIAFDMEKIAADAGTVISASLFGALAGSTALPFALENYEETIRASGRGVDASLAAFREACNRATNQNINDAPEDEHTQPITQDVARGPDKLLHRWQTLQDRISNLPEPVRDMAYSGLKKVVDFQDTNYGTEYLDHLIHVVHIDESNGGHDRQYLLSVAAAKYIANAMAYDDVIRVADLKTRVGRFSRVANEVGVNDQQVLRITEFMHPRADEICGMLPVGLGRFIESHPRLFRGLDRLVNRGRRVRTDSMFWYLVLHTLGGMRRFRRKLLRHDIERAHLESWLETSLSCVSSNYELAVELINNRRLIKGYSDTHTRSLSKFDRVMSARTLIESADDAAGKMKQLRDAALADEHGNELDQFIDKYAKDIK